LPTAKQCSCFGGMKSLYASYASQSAVTFCRCLILLLIVGISACQRSTYLFQRVAEPEHPTLGANLATTSALIIAPAKQPTAVSSSEYRPWHQNKHRVRRLPAAIHRADIVPVLRAATLVSQTKMAFRPKQGPLPPSDQPVRHRSRALTLLLALLGITYLPLSLHNFYLGYYGRGAIAIMLLVAGVYLLFIGTAGLLFAEPSLAPIGYAGLVMLAGWLYWQIADIVHIITGSLKPKNGEYNAHFL
jgi:hypothetical protein